MDFSIHIPSQLHEHLRALRKERGLTQAALGQLLGVGQARVAEIENNPSAVSVAQLMKVLSALRVSLVLRDDVVPEQSLSATTSLVPVESSQRKKPAKQPLVNVPPTGGSWRPVASILALRNDTTTLSDAQASRNANPHSDVLPTSKRNFVIRAKKGSW